MPNLTRRAGGARGIAEGEKEKGQKWLTFGVATRGEKRTNLKKIRS